ncbi:glyoxalase/bleomycin resistance/dioxygenase family protein [Pseudomaricurvus alkylphenolicus]|jgi:catechol 2,3-dioxygenase-like lactoylglutathione lyase family enzyme|uniref:VOC family protein n=1 Tax=Pseudomaricurvus alkylphenolicus TaxID=1306991 RepID=UPI001420C287|nr:VOC family protein [Pseudomaricurvus alkylphenolicus]NIB40976.1 glyoxalase/bleomycin resistance/dioxygenase family protein [Pseudomaricurvus alkylphenolicus]
MILAFAHPGLVVPDLEAAVEFYHKMFGFEVMTNEGWENSPEADRAIGAKGSACRGHLLAGHNCHLELWQYQSPCARGDAPGTLGPHEPGIRHLAFYVDDCKSEFDRLLALGGSALGEPVAGVNDCYVVYCRDPFGNILELCEIPSADENPTRLAGVDRLDRFTGSQ